MHSIKPFKTDEMLSSNMGLMNYLKSLLTEDRLNKFEKILSQRTKHLTIVLENLVEEHNANAVMRTCECFGLQDVYVVSDNKNFKPARRVLQGSHKWLTMHKYEINKEKNTLNCINDLREKGYKIAVTAMHADAIPVENVSIEKPLAVFFGRESTGATDLLLQNADMHTTIPMQGFTSSFNISVSAGIIINQLVSRIRNSDVQWQLTDAEKNMVRFNWIRNCLTDFDLLVKYYFEKNSIGH